MRPFILLALTLALTGCPSEQPSNNDSGADATSSMDANADTTEAMDGTFVFDECVDRDRDGHQDIACGGDDCDDNDPDRYPGRPEWCDGIDSDCDGNADQETTLDAHVHAHCRSIAEGMGLTPLDGTAPPRCVFPNHPWSTDYRATEQVTCMLCAGPDGTDCGCFTGTQQRVDCP